MQNPTQYLALFNLQKYLQNNLQVLNNVNIFKANGIPHRVYVTLTDLALLLFFIGIIITKNYVIIYCFTETKEESPEYINYISISIIFGGLFFAILVTVIGCLAKYGQLKNVLFCKLISEAEERTLRKHVDIFSQLKIQDKKDPTHEAGQEEKHEMLPVFRQKTVAMMHD
jgi:hypothetical protein